VIFDVLELGYWEVVGASLCGGLLFSRGGTGYPSRRSKMDCRESLLECKWERPRLLAAVLTHKVLCELLLFVGVLFAFVVLVGCLRLVRYVFRCFVSKPFVSGEYEILAILSIAILEEVAWVEVYAKTVLKEFDM
jgi:hypothetical protein